MTEATPAAPQDETLLRHEGAGVDRLVAAWCFGYELDLHQRTSAATAAATTSTAATTTPYPHHTHTHAAPTAGAAPPPLLLLRPWPPQCTQVDPLCIY